MIRIRSSVFEPEMKQISSKTLPKPVQIRLKGSRYFGTPEGAAKTIPLGPGSVAHRSSIGGTASRVYRPLLSYRQLVHAYSAKSDLITLTPSSSLVLAFDDFSGRIP